MPSPQPDQPAPPQAEPATQTPTYDRLDLESTKAIADMAQKEYANENDRTKSLDTKATALLAATSAGIAFISGTLFKPPDVIAHATHGPTLVYYGAIVVALLFFAVAEWFFLQSVRIRTEFERVDPGIWVLLSAMEEPARKTYADLAESYRHAVETNNLMNEKKASELTWGLRCLLWGTIALIVVLGAVVWALVAGLLTPVYIGYV